MPRPILTSAPISTFHAEWQELAATMPVGLRHLQLDVVDQYDFAEPVFLRLRAMVLTHRLEDRVVTQHVREWRDVEVVEHRYIERPARRWDALRLAFGVPAHRVEWVKASWVERRTVRMLLETDVEVRIERRDVFPDAQIEYPDVLGQRVVRFEHWEDPRA